MPAMIRNVRIKDLMSLLANLHHMYEAVDIILDPEESRVIINGTVIEEDEQIVDSEKNPNEVELKSKDIGDII